MPHLSHKANCHVTIYVRHCASVTRGWVREFPQFPSFHAKSQFFEVHKYEKHLNVSHNKNSHKVEVLARIYFSITR
jgi:hypothetical protein